MLNKPRDYLPELHRRLPLAARGTLSSAGVVRKYLRGNGTRGVTGGPKLKSTQAYTREFGSCVSSLHRQLTMKSFLKRSPARRTTCGNLPAVDVSNMAEWPDAKLLPVQRFLDRRASKAAGK